MTVQFKKLALGAAFVASLGVFTSCTEKDDMMMDPVSQAGDLNLVEYDTKNGEIIPGKYIVVLNDAEELRQARIAPSYDGQVEIVKNYSKELLASLNIKGDNLERSYGKAVQGFSASLSEAEVELLKNDPRVKYVENDRVIALGRPSGGGGGSTGQETPWGITRVGAGAGMSGYSGKVAFVLDTGIDMDHEDLNVNSSLSRTMFTSGKDARDYDDGNGHGTHVAGTIGAIDNNVGVIGVAPGASVAAVKVLDSRGSGSYSTVIGGVDYVASVAKSGDVANMSLGGPVSQALDDAVLSAAQSGVVFALAAGNDSDHASNHSPAGVNHNNIYTVSASDVNDNFAYFSNYGNPPVDVCAPGVNIKSTWKGGGYNTISGTSMASPHVAGLLLLGNLRSGGTVSGDPDGNADMIAVH